MPVTYVRGDDGQFTKVGPGGATTDTTLSQSGKPADASAVGLALSNKATKEYVDTSVASLSNPNLLINGDFQIWQRGTSFSNIANTYSADRWLIKNAKANTALVEKSTDVPDGQPMCQSIHMTETTEENSYLRYMFENALKGTFTLSFWYKTSAAFNTYIYDSGVLTHLGKLTTLNVWTKAKFTFSATSLTFLSIIHAMSVGDTYITGVKLEYGNAATPFAPRLYAEELELCKRYFQIVSSHRFPMMMITGTAASGAIPLEKTMRVAPTVTVVSFRYFDYTQGAHMEASNLGVDTSYTTNKVVVIQIDKNSASTLAKGDCANGTIHAKFDAEIY